MRKLLEIYEENDSWDYFIVPGLNKDEITSCLRFVIREIESGESKKKVKNL